MSRLLKIEKEHTSQVETYRCDDCQEEFSICVTIVVDYCPRCGVEFTSEHDVSGGQEEIEDE